MQFTINLDYEQLHLSDYDSDRKNCSMDIVKELLIK